MANQITIEAPTNQQASPNVRRDVGGSSTVTRQRKLKSAAIVVCAVLISAALGVYLYLPGLYEVGTDDASADAHAVSVVPKVAAYVSVLHIDDNTKIGRGDLLVELDPRDFQ